MTSSTTRPAKGDTAVTKWLKTNMAAEYVDAFYKGGFYDLKDITPKDIRRIVTTKGDANRLQNALKEATAPPKPAPKPLAPPPLPAGTVVDLSAGEMRAPTGITFQLPTGLNIDSSQEIEFPTELSASDWIFIAKNSLLLYGTTMNQSPPDTAKRPVLDWVVPAADKFLHPEHLTASTRTSVRYTEESNSFVKMGFNSQTATAGFPFASASFERQHRERQAQSAEVRELFMTGMWWYPRARLILELCTRVSPHFVAAARKAVEARNPAAALNKLFEDYGHVIAQDVTLGGVLYFQQSRRTLRSLHTKEVETTIKAAVNIKMGAKGEGGAGAAFQDASGNTVNAQSMADTVTFEVIGGDVTLLSDPAKWTPTVKRAQLWGVIARHGVKSVIDLLDEDLQTKIRALAPPQAWRFASGLFLRASQTVNNAKSNATWVPYRPVGQSPDSDAINIATGMAWSADYQWGNSRAYLTLGTGTSRGAKIVRGGRQVRGNNTGRLDPAQGTTEIHRWGTSTSEEVILMEAATFGPNGWNSSSYISLFVEDFGADTKDGFLIAGGRVEVGSANSKKAFERSLEWPDDPTDKHVQDQRLGDVRMWNPRLQEWGLGRIFLHLVPLA